MPQVPSSQKVNVAVVGLGFGSAFAPIYQAHPRVGRTAICELDPQRLNDVGERHGISDRFTSLEDVLAADWVDAVHLLTPVPDHVDHAVRVLEAGKHCACAVPMATDIDGLRRVIDAARNSGKNYMMMETAVYAREFLYAEKLVREGRLGPITFLRGTYFQDLEGDYPAYWRAQPPMHYATHAIGPVLALAQTRAVRVCCMGSGRLRPDIQIPGANTFPLQTAIMRLAGTDVAAEITKSWFQVARQFVEAFCVYGEAGSVEWPQIDSEDPAVYWMEPLKPGERGRFSTAQRVEAPYRPDLVPPELAPFVRGGHGGSHPHLVHEFVSSIVEGRPSRIDAVTAADWCAAGICANESSLQDGAPIRVPPFHP